MNGTLFLDTSGWLAAISRREAAHEPARAAYADQILGGGTLVTTALVIAEMHVLLLKLGGPGAPLRFLDGLAADPTHEIIDVDRDLRLAAIERWLRRFADQEISLTDAVSFEVMRRRKLRRALALDRDFLVAGFELVPVLDRLPGFPVRPPRLELDERYGERALSPPNPSATASSGRPE